MELTGRLLDLAGIGRERLRVEWVSSAEGKRFAEIAADVTESIRNLGRFDPAAFNRELKAAELTLNAETIRWLVGKEISLTSQGDVYGRRLTPETLGQVMEKTLQREYQKNLIFLAVAEEGSSVREISAQTGLELGRVSALLTDMEKASQLQFSGFKDREAYFRAI